MLHPGERLGDSRGSGTREARDQQRLGDTRGLGTQEARGHERLGDTQAGLRAGQQRVATKLPRGLQLPGSGGAGTHHPRARWRRELEGQRGGCVCVHPVVDVRELLRSVWPRHSPPGCGAARPARIAASGCLGWPSPCPPCTCVTSAGSSPPAHGTGDGPWLVPGWSLAGPCPGGSRGCVTPPAHTHAHTHTHVQQTRCRGGEAKGSAAVWSHDGA